MFGELMGFSLEQMRLGELIYGVRMLVTRSALTQLRAAVYGCAGAAGGLLCIAMRRMEMPRYLRLLRQSLRPTPRVTNFI